MRTPHTPEGLYGLGRPLEGVRVIDLTRLLPGPFATLLLGDMGADVVKVEAPRGGDYARYYQPFVGPMGAFFASIHRNKRSVTLDLKSEDGAALLAQLLEDADVLLESFRPGVMERLGFGPERLARDFPGLVACSISGYGQTGPARGEAGHDINYLARAGLLHGTGSAGSATLAVPGFQAADLAGGALYAVSAVLAALFKRTRTGRGARLDVSMTEGVLSMMLPALGMLSAGAPYGGAAAEMLNGGFPCYGVYRTRDGEHMALGALEPKFWANFCAAVGWHDRIGDGHDSGAKGAATRDALAALFAEKTRDAWVEQLDGVDCCCVPVRRPDELTDDPLFQARDVFFALDSPHTGTLQQVATPLTPADRSAFSPPPLLGEHTDEVLGELGVGSERLAELRAAGVIA